MALYKSHNLTSSMFDGKQSKFDAITGIPSDCMLHTYINCWEISSRLCEFCMYWGELLWKSCYRRCMLFHRKYLIFSDIVVKFSSIYATIFLNFPKHIQMQASLAFKGEILAQGNFISINVSFIFMEMLHCVSISHDLLCFNLFNVRLH